MARGTAIALGMARTYLVPVLAMAGMIVAVVTVVKASKPAEPVPPTEEPPRASFESFVAGSGIVETGTQNIAVGTPIAGLVIGVGVTAGDRVEAGKVLFEIDDRDARATLESRKAAIAVKGAALQVRKSTLEVRKADAAVAESALAQLKALPRAETIPQVEARLADAQAAYNDAKSQLDKWLAVTDERAVSKDAIEQKRFAAESAQARVNAARADLALLKAGAFEPDLAAASAKIESARSAVKAAEADVMAAQAEVQAAQADAKAVEVELERRQVRAPVSGRVLQVNVRKGEFAAAGPTGPGASPLILMGVTEPLVIRTDIDEHEAWRVKEGSRAEAFLRGNGRFKVGLAFLRFEPYIVPKKSLTGDSTERVDTRVLQVLFTVDKTDFPLFIGQQMDVYIESPPVREDRFPLPR